MHCRIHTARPADTAAITELMLAAFGDGPGREISGLVRGLMADPAAAPRLPLAAMHDASLAGYVLFTRAQVATAGQGTVPASILAPLAVRPACQSQGIGGRLIAQGIARLEATDAALLFVLGDPGYYSRHGFRPAGAVGLQAPYPIPAEQADAWMVRPLKPDFIGRLKGQISCAAALMDPRYWRE